VSLRSVGKWSTGRGGVFAVELVYLIALWVVAGLYFGHTIHPRHTIGNMPTVVPWFGALGAVLISMVGIFEHAVDWNRRYALWHWARPIVGGSFAVISVLILQAGIVSVGSDPHTPGGSLALYYVVGFVVGYREETFRELVKRFADVLLKPADPASSSELPPTISALTPSSGPAAGGTGVVIDGSGFNKVLSVKFGNTDAASVISDSSTRLRATSPAGCIGAQGVTVTTKAGTAMGAFTYT
jgi:hypothetical protein